MFYAAINEIMDFNETGQYDMKDIEIVALTNGIEGKYPVDEWEVFGRHVWPYIKMVICNYMSERDNIDSLKESISLKRNTLRMKRGINALFINNGIKKSIPSDVLILHHNNARNLVLDNGKCFDYNLDPFTLLLESHCKILSMDYMYDSKYKNTFTDTYFINCNIDKALINSKIKNIFNIKVDYKLDEYDAFLNELTNDLKEKLTIKRLIASMTYINCLCDFFYRIIVTKRIKFVIAGCGYGIDTIALFMACSDAGIKCMEVQHGLAGGSGHRWYSSWTRLPKYGCKYEMLPDIYWCWSEYDKQAIDSWGKGRHVAFYGHKPIFCVLDKLEKMTYRKTLSIKSEKKNILFSLQPEVEYPVWMKEVIKETVEDYNWLIRRHPRADRQQEKFIQSISDIKGVYVEEISSVMLEKVLLETCLHVTNHSAVALDALELDIKTIILEKENVELFSREIQNGMIYVARDKNSMLKLIYSLAEKKDSKVANYKDVAIRAEKFLRQQI